MKNQIQTIKLLSPLEDGEKIIIVDQEGAPQSVLMTYGAYQKLRRKSGDDSSPENINQLETRGSAIAQAPQNLTSDELLAKINFDIAQWNLAETNPELDNSFLLTNNCQDSKHGEADFDLDKEATNEEDNFYLETIEE
ncbi:MAG: hypothetical protein A2445_04230 [Candidatus Jacksonbacteria bacterium RIFOXYC2_FULL_44_29]|nr:MAG: hypothetical protein UV19_C0001G0008 [Parcubacteria group bacterium GW2011_GWA2_42_28]KKT56203.1 MAG: hypothetical protein UW45_C0001G0007 [Parcubacteria group bacterium GW2011_GWC2_44_22]OGY76145.1 MAG: hypothetical protein A2240_00450 [Candidatus Jacksonbacteria bacterium RIFOXYA2_FULL_43_12]OGY77735.1 MAG: hypothetical protein A2295_02950 [Candidatus Jacksonbacteria bacterium RIFOXYB2_FULL_44_15]OGY78872.1 MAG: hypothetical protein A2550_05015 [Candidatus Jacksonbacteria bacterium RI